MTTPQTTTRKLTAAFAAILALYALFALGMVAAVLYQVLPADRTEAGLIAAGAITLAAVLAVGGAWMSARKTLAPVRRLADTLHKVDEGDFQARVGLGGDDELGRICRTIDTVLGLHVTALDAVENENSQLNDSIVTLLETVAQMAEKDLTIRARVGEDITGPLADALNLMTSETARVLREVTAISGDVADASNQVKSQSDIVSLLAAEEHKAVEQSASELQQAAERMTKVARLAKFSTTVADKAMQTTTLAVESVTATVDGIDAIRTTIRETEKRIKRLGERSQEISGVVSLIDNIAERTHILALNASMHAASAGEAGHGFAVVAEEVQRLAENAREATSHIATLVNNIQVETADSIGIMNKVITEVVEGSRLAADAGQQMQQTQQTTTELVELVQKIAAGAVTQARTSNALLNRTQRIRASVRKTAKHLHEQAGYTDQLVNNAMDLVASVGVFQLPDEEAA